MTAPSRKRRVVLLGSTGSIGCSTLKVARELPDEIEIVALAAGSQCRETRRAGPRNRRPPRGHLRCHQGSRTARPAASRRENPPRRGGPAGTRHAGGCGHRADRHRRHRRAVSRAGRHRGGQGSRRRLQGNPGDGRRNHHRRRRKRGVETSCPWTASTTRFSNASTATAAARRKFRG